MAPLLFCVCVAMCFQHHFICLPVWFEGILMKEMQHRVPLLCHERGLYQVQVHDVLLRCKAVRFHDSTKTIKHFLLFLPLHVLNTCFVNSSHHLYDLSQPNQSLSGRRLCDGREALKLVMVASHNVWPSAASHTIHCTAIFLQLVQLHYSC